MKRITFSLLSLVVLSLGFLLTPARASAQTNTPAVVVLNATGPVTQTMLDYIKRGLNAASTQNAGLVVVQLDTPGGSIVTMEQIIQAIRASSVPVIVYVTPQNAMAGSAGALITMAGHLSGMAPETTIGASSPVGGGGEDLTTTEEAKQKEITKAMARTLTQNRPPAATKLAEDMIETARAVTVDEAVKIGLVDFKANDLTDLLDQADGHVVQLPSGPVTLHTHGANIVPINPSFIERLLEMLINPNLLFMLLSVGVMAILIELASPGGWVAGTLGSLALLVAFYGIGLLPVNGLGLLVITLAFVLFLLDIKAPTHGALTAAGTAAFIAGSLILFNNVRIPGVPRISVPLVVGSGLFIAAGFLTVLTFALRAQRLPVQTGRETLVGQTGIVRAELNPRGIVHVAGEMWGAEDVECVGPVPEGTRVEVVAVDGLRLKVRRLQ
jgi:membrane-bound serine protease (ClpP class)